MSMSVDFYLEVRHEEKWSLLRWKQPTELETFFRVKSKNRWETRAVVFTCDYRFINGFLDEILNDRYETPKDLTPELNRILRRSKNSCGTGFIPVKHVREYLNNKREEMLEGLIQSRDYQMVYKLNMISNKICGTKDNSPIDVSEEYYKSCGIREIYESYEDRIWAVDALAAAIKRFTNAFWVHVEDTDMRIVFKLR